MNDDVYFELVEEDEVPFHECGHYHPLDQECPSDRTCTSELCCVLGGAPRR